MQITSVRFNIDCFYAELTIVNEAHVSKYNYIMVRAKANWVCRTH